MKRICMMVIFLFAFATMAKAQTHLLFFSNYTHPLTDECSGKGKVLPDSSTMIFVFQDLNGNGADKEDKMPPVTLRSFSRAGELTLNKFPMNGTADVVSNPGCFAPEAYAVSGGGVAFPEPTQFYLVVPFGDYAQAWVSEVWTVKGIGLQEHDYTKWKCQKNIWIDKDNKPVK